MRCQDVTRELAAPTGRPTPGEVADHLASCPACAERSRSAARLDRIWEATRPAEPSPQALDTLWARASAGIDDARRPGVIPFKAATRRRRWPVVALVGAQAAALLVGLAYLLRLDEPAAVVHRDPDPPAAAPEPSRVTSNVDQTLVVRIDEHGRKVEVEMLDDSAQFGLASMADATPHDVFSAVESMAAQ